MIIYECKAYSITAVMEQAINHIKKNTYIHTYIHITIATCLPVAIINQTAKI
jgi:hypothetical protein